ncbi:MAG: hypothetical protein ACMXYA_01850 [Candidatus Woesearchaeota archaeon]
MQWFKELGFSRYPLDPRSNPNLVGVDDIQEQITQYIVQGNMCLLAGFTGSGKTSMLQRISRSKDVKDYRFIFISADGVKKNYDIDDAIKDSKSFIELITFKKPRKIVVLLDESHLANRILTESIKSKWNFVYPNGDRMIQSVIVSQIEPQLGTNFSGSFIDRLGKRIVQMKRLSVEELIAVLQLRLDNGTKNYIDIFTKDGLDFLTKSADGSVRQLLEYTDVVFRKICTFKPNPLVTDESFRIDKSIVFNILQEAGLAVYEKSALTKKGNFQKLLGIKRLKNAIDMFDQFGTLSAILLAEKLDVTKATAQKLLNELKKKDALVESHIEDDETFYVLTPRLKHELVKQ